MKNLLDILFEFKTYFEFITLFVKGKISYIYRARTFEYGRREPCDVSVTVNDHVSRNLTKRSHIVSVII